MRHIDFYAQTGILIGTLVLLALFSGYGLLLGQAVLGGWQVLSCIISVVFFQEFRKAKLWHLSISCVVVITFYLSDGHPSLLNDFVFLLLVMLPSWGLAIYYFVITWRWHSATGNRSKFLPNISF